MIESSTVLIPLVSIHLDRTQRQRSSIDSEKVAELAKSIADRDLIHPILVTNLMGVPTIVAGEHRMLAFRWLESHKIPCNNPDYQNWSLIPAHFAVNATDQEIHILELEENIRRVQLDWKDEAKAIQEYFTLRQITEPEFTHSAAADALGISPRHVSRSIAVAEELAAQNPKLAAASSIRSAYTVIERANERAINSELDELLSVSKPADVPAPIVFEDSILLRPFGEWWPEYSGPKFNLLHCDFPYGVNFNAGEQSRAEALGAYDDSPEVYWNLLSELTRAVPAICSPSCHMVFWFSMNYYQSTVEALRRFGWSVNPFPLIWHKTDNKGLLPDPERGPRRVYETALLCSLGDRKIVKAVSNTYGAPTSKHIHPSEKPESVLRHFFQMLVDEHTVMLDPTAGSGSALRAAEALGAKFTLGLDINPEFVELSNAELNKSRRLRSMSQ